MTFNTLPLYDAATDYQNILNTIIYQDILINKIIDTLVDSLQQEGTIFLAGNGGSASIAEHLATEFIGKLTISRPSLRAIALTTNTSLLTALSNDYGYDEVFARQLEALGDAGDTVLLFTTSGQSENLIVTTNVAKIRDISTIAFTGKEGGELANLVDLELRIPSNNTQRIQEAHLFLGHYIIEQVERRLFT